MNEIKSTKESQVKIAKGNNIDIVIEYNDTDFVKVTQKFLDDLKEQFDVFNKEYQQKSLEFENLKDKRINDDEKNKSTKIRTLKNIHFSPEVLSVASPLTIINAPWGSGKTYFIEKLINNLIEEKINADYFKNVIVLDVWKYSTHKDIPNEIMKALYDIMKKQANEGNIIIDNLALIFYSLFGIVADGFLKKVLKEKDKQNEIEKSIKSLNKNMEYTLIIFDNIERVGIKGWEIMKAIFKIMQLERMIFILPMNIDMFDNKTNDNNEYSIEKYLNIKYFNLIQDYSSFLVNQDLTEFEMEIFNKLLETQIDGEQLSIRQLQERFKNNRINEKKVFFSKIKLFSKEVWGKNEDLKVIFYDYIAKILIKHINNLRKCDYEIKLELSDEIYWYGTINLTQYSQLVEYDFYPSDQYESKYENLIKYIENNKKEINEKIEFSKEEILKIDLEIERINKLVRKYQSELSDAKSVIENEEKRKDYRDTEKAAIKKFQVEEIVKEIKKLEQEISELNEKEENEGKNIDEFWFIDQWDEEKVAYFLDEYKKIKNNFLEENMDNKIIWNKAILEMKKLLNEGVISNKKISLSQEEIHRRLYDFSSKQDESMYMTELINRIVDNILNDDSI